MGKKYLKVVSISLLLSGLTLTNTGCNAGDVKVTFVSEGNSDVIRYVKKGKTLVDIPDTPKVKGKYCLWDRDTFQNLNEDLTVHANCFSTVVEMNINIEDEIHVDVSSSDADLDYLLKDLEVDVEFESGEKRKLYPGEYTLDTNGYNKDVSGTYLVGVIYNNARKDVKINVNKIKNYVTVSLNGGKGYLNEGLPKLIANTNVEGEVSFDPNQALVKGTKSYSWTFTPADKNKYEIVKGNIEVELVNADLIIANKNALTVEFGTTKEQIIDLIMEDLIVEARYGNVYKEIESQYYTIDSSTFVVDKSGTFDFNICYDEYTCITPPISVTVKKCDTYVLNVNDISEFIIKEDSKLEDILPLIRKSSNIDGDISFVEGQRLAVGKYDYQYIFTPHSNHYAPRVGVVNVHSYKAEDMVFTTLNEFEYGTSKESIMLDLKNKLTGDILYNDALAKSIDTDMISITIIDSFRSNVSGEYTYRIFYNDEIEKTGSFTLKKITLSKVEGTEGDFTVACGEVDPNNFEVMPICTIKRSESSKYDFDPNLFTIIPLSSRRVSEYLYEYEAEVVPDESISNNYEIIKITIKITYYQNTGPNM